MKTVGLSTRVKGFWPKSDWAVPDQLESKWKEGAASRTQLGNGRQHAVSFGDSMSEQGRLERFWGLLWFMSPVPRKFGNCSRISNSVGTFCLVRLNGMIVEKGMHVQVFFWGWGFRQTTDPVRMIGSACWPFLRNLVSRFSCARWKHAALRAHTSL